MPADFESADTENTGRRVGFICSSLSWGGLEMNVRNLAFWLERRGCSVSVLTLAGSPLQVEAAKWHLSIHTIPPHRKYLDIRGARRILQFLSAHGIDTIVVSHRNDFDMMAWARILSKKRLTLIYLQQMRLGPPRKDIIHTLRYNQYSAWITPLLYLREEVLAGTKIPEGRIHVIPLGIDVNRFADVAKTREEARAHFNLPAGKTIFGVMGRIERGKGQGFLVRAIARLRRSGLDVGLLIVGEENREGGDHHLEEVRMLAREYQIEDHIVIHPFLDDNFLFYKAIDIFAMATLTETFGMVTVEAMAAGVPVIGSDSGGTQEILEFGSLGMLFKPGDLDDFVLKAGAMLRNTSSLAERADRARKKVEQAYSHERQVSLTLSLLERLAAERPG
jgi:glycosyltransferase involved in cell wall biosynthesis